MSALAPDAFVRRSFVYRALLALGATFVERDGAAVAVTFGDPERERVQAQVLGLCDLSPLPRCGFKGNGAAAWLEGLGVSIPGAVNRATMQPDGALVGRLGANDFLVLGDLRGSSRLALQLPELWQRISPPPAAARGFPVPRQDSHCWFCVSGGHAPDTLAKLCGVDLRLHKFSAGSVAQTLVAELSAIVIRSDLGTTPAFHVLTDSAAAEYAWECLRDAMQEFSGRPVGLQALCELESQG